MGAWFMGGGKGTYLVSMVGRYLVPRELSAVTGSLARSVVKVAGRYGRGGVVMLGVLVGFGWEEAGGEGRTSRVEMECLGRR